MGHIDPTGRSDRFASRKLIRLLVLLAGVFVVGAGIGWLVGQISAPSDNSASQRAATTLPQSLPTATESRNIDALAPPQPAPITPADQRAVTSVIAQASQQPSSPPPGTVITNPAASAKPQQLVLIEPPPEQPVAAAAEPASAPPISEASSPIRAARKHVLSRARHERRRNSAIVPAGVTVIGAKSAHAGARWIVQLGAFKTHDHAALLVLTLRSHGAVAQIVRRNEGARGLWYVVETPSVASLNAARETARQISARERVAAFVEPLGG